MIVNGPLYTLDAVSGKTRVWQIEVEGDGFRTVSGLVGGKMVTSEWNKCEPKNTGRANATTAEEQALLEAQSHYRVKLERKYHVDPEKVGRHKFFAPMLAEKFKGWTGRCFCQPKLDGIRMIASAGGMTSRQGKPFSLPHIWDALQPLFEADPELVLDGELYNHDLKDDFNTIHGLARREKRTPEQDEELRRVLQYHVYDVPSNPHPFLGRATDLAQLKFDLEALALGPIRTVETSYVETSELLDQYYGEYLEQGYEGQMVRLDQPYEVGKRSKFLLKRKEFEDQEFPVSLVEEGRGNWAGHAKRVEFIMPGDKRKENGERPEAGIKGNKAFTRELLQDWKKYEGVTIRYPNLTPDGFPRFGVAVAWHEKLAERD
jgi:DNA ligase-1